MFSLLVWLLSLYLFSSSFFFSFLFYLSSSSSSMVPFVSSFVFIYFKKYIDVCTRLYLHEFNFIFFFFFKFTKYMSEESLKKSKSTVVTMFCLIFQRFRLWSSSTINFDIWQVENQNETFTLSSQTGEIRAGLDGPSSGHRATPGY